MIATQEDKYENAKLLIEHGANIDDQDYLFGNFQYHFAVSIRHMRILIENGAFIDFKALDGATALTYAVNNKQKEMDEFQIESGANIDSTCNNLKTPLHFALMLNLKEFVILLLQNGAFFTAKNQDKINPIEEGLIRNQMTVFKTTIAYDQF